MDGRANVPEQRFGKRATLYCASTGWHFTGAARSGGFAKGKRFPNPREKKNMKGLIIQPQTFGLLSLIS